MRNSVGRVAFATAAVLLASLLHASAASASAITFSPSSSSVSVGDLFSVDVRVSDITDLYDFSFDFGFDPTILAIDSSDDVTEGSFLGGATGNYFQFEDDPGSWTVLDDLSGAVPGVTGDGVLATIGFRALAPTTSPSLLTFSNLIFDNSQSDDGGLPIAISGVEAVGGSVTVNGPQGSTPVPEPGSGLLLASGLAVTLIWAGARSQRKVPVL